MAPGVRSREQAHGRTVTFVAVDAGGAALVASCGLLAGGDPRRLFMPPLQVY
jgi:hypothetical protein